MADYTVQYPNGWIWYDGDNQDNMGMVEDDTSSPYQYRFNDTIHYTWNLTGHDNVNNPVEKEIFTFSNGVRYCLSVYYTESDDAYNIQCDTKYYDNEGSIINVQVPRFTISEPKQFYSDVTALDVWYCSSKMTYSQSGDEVERPAGVFIHQISNASPYDPPDITHNVVSRQNFSTYYGIINTSNPFGDDLDDFIGGITAHGDDTPINPKDPLDDPSGPGGGGGDNNPFSDPIDFPGLPTGGDSISTGFVRVYTPTTSQLRLLANKLWDTGLDPDSFVNTITKIQNDPMEAVISLHSIPISLSGSSSTCMIGNYNSGISMPAVSQQFHSINMGSISIPEHWGTALDYSPYTTIDMFLPFVGVVTLMVDDVVGKTLSVQYNVDIISGATLVSVKCGNSVLYTYNTNMILPHPMSASSFAPLYQSVLGMVGSVASGFAMGGAGGAIGGAVGGALNVALSKHSSVNRGGTIGGATGVLGNFAPYLIIHRPIQSLAQNFKHFKGFPSNITATISSLSGYTEFESVHLTGIPCTDAERDEIQALLYNGVIV